MSVDRGVRPDQAIESMLEAGEILREGGPDPARIQPCSLDLTLSAEAYRMPGSALPLQTESVRTLIETFRRRRLDLSEPEVLDRGKVYLVRLAESLKLPADVAAYTNNKSSVGRVDVQTRTLCDRNPRFDKIPSGYSGELFLEITPRSFDIELQAGVSLNQAIFYDQRRLLGTEELRGLMSETPLVTDRDGVPVPTEDILVEDGVLMTIDLTQDIVGWVARHTTEELSLVPGRLHDAELFFEPIPRPPGGRLLLRRGHFYILATSERLRVPANYAVEMLPYETSAGEFRAHYAGFFDPGFGWSPRGETMGTPAVLEVRPYDDDLILRHGQPICKLAYEHLTVRPRVAYGEQGLGSHYAAQRGPRLSRFFRDRPTKP